MTPHKRFPATWLSRHDIGKPQGVLFLLWILLNAFFFLHRGIYLEGESAKYIYQGQHLLDTGAPESANFWLYSVQIALVACCLKLHLSFYPIIVIQLLFNGIATAFFYKTLEFLFAKKRIAVVGTLLLLGNYFYQEFNTFLYTESLFYSFTLLLSCYLLHIQHPTIKRSAIVIGMLAIICITRPTGLLYIPPVLLYFFFVFFRKLSPPKKLALFTLLGIAFLLLLDTALGSGGELDLMLPFRDENIICGVPTLSSPTDTGNPTNHNSLLGLLQYILHHFPQFLRLALLKTRAFFGLYRDYYSTGHNLYLMAYFYPLFLLALISIGWWRKNQPYPFFYFISIIGLTWLTVILTCDDWHNRFYLDISPFLIILAMPAFFRRNLRSNTR